MPHVGLVGENVDSSLNLNQSKVAQEWQLTSIALGLQVLVNPLKDTELIFYGGEYYNGDKVSIMGTMPMLLL